jgi:hypothetical protein
MSTIRRLPPPQRRPGSTWIVVVYGEPAVGREWTSEDLRRFDEAYGWGTDEYAEAVGPSDGYQAVTHYGPYTKRQAEKVAAYVRDHEKVGSAYATPLHRYISVAATSGAAR